MKLPVSSFPNFINSWIIAVSCSGINFLLDGFVRISGILFVSVQEVYGTTRQNAAFPFALCVAIRNLSGPCVGVFAERYGPGSITLLGGIVTSTAVGLSYFSQNTTHLILSWGVLFGIGYAMGNILLAVIIARTYKDKMALASGISYSGSCIGSMLLPPLLNFTLSLYGLQGTFLIISGILLHCVPLSLLILYNESSSIKEFLKPRKERHSSFSKSVEVRVGNHFKNSSILDTDKKYVYPATLNSSMDGTDSGKGSTSWQDALENKHSFMSGISSRGSHSTLSCQHTVTSTTDEKADNSSKEVTENKGEDRKNLKSIKDAHSSIETSIMDIHRSVNEQDSNIANLNHNPKFYVPSEDDFYEGDIVKQLENDGTAATEPPIFNASLGIHTSSSAQITDHKYIDSNISEKPPDLGLNCSSEPVGNLPDGLQNKFIQQNAQTVYSDVNLEQSQLSLNHLVKNETRIGITSNIKEDKSNASNEVQRQTIELTSQSNVPPVMNDVYRDIPQAPSNILPKRRTFPEIKVSVIEYIVTAPGCYSEDHVHKHLNSRGNKYRRHANSISYSLESPNFLLELAEKPDIKRSFTSRSLTNFRFDRHSFSQSLEQQQLPTKDSSNKSIIYNILKSLTIFKNPLFLCIAMMMTVYEYIFVTMSTVIIDYSRDIGCEKTTDHWILIIFSAGNILGRLCLGWITDMHFMQGHAFAATCFAGISATMVGISFANSFNVLVAVVFAFGLLESAVITMFPVITEKFIEKEKLTMALSSGYFGPGLIVLIIPSVIGGFRDWAGSYHGLLYVNSGVAMMGVISCLALPWIKPKCPSLDR